MKDKDVWTEKIDTCEHVGMVEEAQFKVLLNSTLGLYVYLLPCFLGAFAELRKATVSFVTSVRPPVQSHATTRLRLDGIFMKFDMWFFSKICRKNSSFVKTWKEYGALYTKTNVHFWSHLHHFFVKWKMFHTNDVQKKKHTFTCIFLNFFPESRGVYEIVWKNTVEPGRRRCIACYKHTQNI